MKILRRVNLIESKNKQNKQTLLAPKYRDMLKTGKKLTPAEQAVLGKDEMNSAGRAAAAGLGKARRATDPVAKKMHAGGAGINIRRGREIKKNLDTANTAYPLTADRVFMFENTTRQQEAEDAKKFKDIHPSNRTPDQSATIVRADMRTVGKNASKQLATFRKTGDKSAAFEAGRNISSGRKKRKLLTMQPDGKYSGSRRKRMARP